MNFSQSEAENSVKYKFQKYKIPSAFGSNLGELQEGVTICAIEPYYTQQIRWKSWQKIVYDISRIREKIAP